jgi:hypothetical protein
MPVGKTGKLTPDEDGYYTLVVGALAAFNSVGAWYDLEESRKCFQESSPFMRRVNDGVLYAELDHPEKKPGWSFRDYVARLSVIQQDRHAAHIKKVWLDNENIKDENGKPFCAILAKIKPDGVFGHVLKSRLESADQNVCFSIRSLTNDQWVGNLLVKCITKVITFDLVLEPGIKIARKWYSPALEALTEAFVVTKEMLSNIVADRMHQGLGHEDSTTASIESMINEIDWGTKDSLKIPPSMKW